MKVNLTQAHTYGGKIYDVGEHEFDEKVATQKATAEALERSEKRLKDPVKPNAASVLVRPKAAVPPIAPPVDDEAAKVKAQAQKEAAERAAAEKALADSKAAEEKASEERARNAKK